MEEQEEIIKAKPGPKAKPKLDVDALLARLHNLEQLVLRIGHNSGVSHQIIIKAGLEPYVATAGDMGKFKKVS